MAARMQLNPVLRTSVPEVLSADKLEQLLMTPRTPPANQLPTTASTLSVNQSSHTDAILKELAAVRVKGLVIADKIKFGEELIRRIGDVKVLTG